jgi:hypothetical protein
LPIIEHGVAVYKLWYGYRDNFPKKSRYTLGDRIDSVFLRILELLFAASYQSKEQKLPTLDAAVRSTDILKFLLRISWEVHALDTQKYALLSEKLHEFGRMLGGWRKGVEPKTPAPERGRNA